MEKTKAGWINRLVARPLMTIALIGALLIAANTKAEASASPETAHSFYAVEFSYKNGAQTVRYATRDVAKISVSVIAEQLGLSGEITGVTAEEPYGYYSAKQENGQWYICTIGVPTSNTSKGDLYTGDLFGGTAGRYYGNSYYIDNDYFVGLRPPPRN